MRKPRRADFQPNINSMIRRVQDMFYFCNVGSGGAATKVIGRSQTLSVEVGITTVAASECALFQHFFGCSKSEKIQIC